MGTLESCEELVGSNEEKIYVSVRLRPLDNREILRNEFSDWDCINDNTIVYKNIGLSSAERSMYPTVYTFDRVFGSDCSTREVYEKAAKDVAISVVDGVNSSVFAYGQTSSGKTYTMTGVTEYAIADIYDYIQRHPEREFVLRFSALEIYNESVRDLLSADITPLRLLDDPDRGTIVERLTEVTLMDWNHVIELLSVCEAQRQIGETSLNETSSRSHQIIRLTIESSSRELLARENASTLNATVNFVDLAGSERASQTLSAGTRLKEGCHINRSLLTLGTVIRKLSKGRNGHIPYRDSKLTRILQTSLGGNARTAIICTMSPARCHVEQSRNTLLFASCAKEVTTNAQVNVVMSDKALVKYLQREIARLESELRSCSQSITTVPSDYSAIIRDKDLQIEELEKKNKDLMKQRDVAQSQVRDLLQLLGDNASPITPVRTVNYPQLRVREFPQAIIPEQETSILADPHSFNIDTTTYLNRHSRSSSEDHFAKVPYYEENFASNNIPPRILINSSNFSESDSYHNWDEAEKQSNASSEDLCREVRCIETEDATYEERKGSNRLSDEENRRFDLVNEHLENAELLSPPLGINQQYSSSHLRINGEVKNDLVSETIDPQLVSRSFEPDNESPSPVLKNETDYSSKRFFNTPSVQKPSFNYDLDDSSGTRSSRLTRSMSCRASIITDSASSLFKLMECGENTLSEKDPISFEKKISPWSITSKGQKSLSRKDSETSQGNALDIGIDIPDLKPESAKDVMIRNTANICEAVLGGEKVEPQNNEELVKNPAKESEPNANESPKKIAKDVGLDRFSDELRNSLSWHMKFKRLQREIIQLWHDCNASLVHRTYFFLLFQGDPSDAIYLEVELRRMNFLKNKLINSGKTIVDGRLLTANSSAKALRQERKMLSKQMRKKLLEQERESLYLKWNIGLNTKLRRMQLSRRVWSKPEDMNHISDSAFLVGKLVGFVETGTEAPDKEMFGLNFTPTHSTRASSFRRGFTYLL